MKIVELRPGARRVDLDATVLEIGEVRDVTLRTGETGRVANVKIQDESGTMSMSLWNEQIDMVTVNDKIRVENGYVTSFRGETQLNVGKYGKLTVLREPQA